MITSLGCRSIMITGSGCFSIMITGERLLGCDHYPGTFSAQM